MRKFTFSKNYLIAITSIFVMFSCSEEAAETSELELELESVSQQLKTSGTNVCSSKVNFADLLVETTWISGKTGDRDEYGACVADGEAWMDRITKGRYQMKCLQGDGHRTELKEDYGDEAALDEYKKMEFSGTFTNIPENGITIAQIHNRHSSVKRPFVRLYIDDDWYIKIKETETSPNGSSSSYSTYTGPKYTEGADIDVAVWTGLDDQKKAQFRVITDGNTWNKTVYPSSAWDKYSNDYYLKAGVYTEGDDKEVQVIYDYFSIDH